MELANELAKNNEESEEAIAITYASA
ncbi:uncharacterized protein G2W53_017364 [Senna tora]|uniref:Uncharacterized protein n=1 Tax=Senna tora TaxID=362788 RepID=A0A834TQA2_9FABA|nr:uncharacterized protein G2W53_017364 [Senna tora]